LATRQPDQFDAADEIHGQRKHLIDEFRDLRPGVDRVVNAIDFVIEAVASNERELAGCRRIIRQREPQTRSVAPVDQESE
jgi:hypothetical protein